MNVLGTMLELAPATRRQVLQLISRIFNWCISFQLYEGFNPCRAVEKEKLNNSRLRYLDQEELTRLMYVLDNWLNERAWLAHGIHFSDEEIIRLGDAGVGVAHCPWVEQQFWASQHISGKFLSIAALQNVAEFIANLAAAEEEVR